MTLKAVILDWAGTMVDHGSLAPLDVFRRAFAQVGIDIPDGEYVTLGGLLFERFGHIPAEGESVRVGDWDMRVMEMDKRRVAQVVATFAGGEAGPPQVTEANGDDAPARETSANGTGEAAR